MKISFYYKILIYILVFFAFSSFLGGFYLNENSAGAGDYTGDITNIWPNLQIWLTNDIISSIHHEEYYSSRTPFLYFLHKTLNPFTDNIESFRKSVFLFSLSLPILFYFSLRERFIKSDKLLLLLISSTICFSPYFRTSAYWGLEENFGFIFLLLSFLSLNFFLKNNNINRTHIFLILTTFFSACCLYFDQKLIIIPLICFIKILTSNKLLQLKALSIFYYAILSLPYIYLIVLWKGLIPPALLDPNTGRKLGDEIFLLHIGYAMTMIAFYLVPLLLFKERHLTDLIKNFLKDKNNYYFLALFFIYITILILFSDFSDQSALGKGFVHKISNILFENEINKILFVFFSFFISWIIILIYVEKKLIDILTIVYLLILSIAIWPIFQEYFDPLILLMVFTFFGSKLYVNYKNSIILYAYFLVFIVSINIYYANLLS